MNDLKIVDNDIKMTSLDVAEMTGKQHAHIMRDIRNEVEQLERVGIFNESIFGLVTYIDKKGEKRNCYQFGMEGALQLGARYSAETRHKMIQHIKKLEKEKQAKTIKKPDELAEAKLRNSRAREASILLKIADRTELSKEYKQILHSHATEIIAGRQLLPLPEAEKQTYSAAEIGSVLGISANKVGRLANTYNLKTDQYGKLYRDKSKYSNKEVDTFRYFEDVITVLEGLI